MSQLLDSKHTITITPIDGRGDAVHFAAPNNAHVAHNLWVFFIANIRPGFRVMLSTSESILEQPSGKPLSPEAYARIIGAA